MQQHRLPITQLGGVGRQRALTQAPVRKQQLGLSVVGHPEGRLRARGDHEGVVRQGGAAMARPDAAPGELLPAERPFALEALLANRHGHRALFRAWRPQQNRRLRVLALRLQPLVLPLDRLRVQQRQLLQVFNLPNGVRRERGAREEIAVERDAGGGAVDEPSQPLSEPARLLLGSPPLALLQSQTVSPKVGAIAALPLPGAPRFDRG